MIKHSQMKMRVQLVSLRVYDFFFKINLEMLLYTIEYSNRG